MEFEKPSPEMIAFFAGTVPEGEGVVNKRVFGFPACFVNGNMFMGLHENLMILRLGTEKSESFRAETGAPVFEPMPGRPMKEYSVVPQDVLADCARLTSLIQDSLAYGRSLPPKEKKAKKPAK